MLDTMALNYYKEQLIKILHNKTSLNRDKSSKGNSASNKIHVGRNRRICNR